MCVCVVGVLWCVVCGVVGCCVVDFIATVYLGKLEFRQSELGLLAPPTHSLRLFVFVVWCGAISHMPFLHFVILTWLRGAFALGDGMCRCV